MTVPADQPLFAFAGHRLLARGPAAEVVAAVKTATDAGETVLTFDAVDGRVVDLDLRGDIAAVLARLIPASGPERRGPGRPKLGVTAREVTLLPRHWDWLAGQPGGASAVLRRLVEEARREAAQPDRRRRHQETLYRAMSVLAGDLPAFDEAARALFADDMDAFQSRTEAWPVDVAAYLRRLVEAPQD